jgi:peroxin-6
MIVCYCLCLSGKTLIAKAVANECGINFLSVKGPELLNMYIGESEKNVRDVFARARSVKPCVLFFDELDSLAPARGRGSDGGGVMDRVVSQLLTEIDGINGNDGIFVIGATNRPDLIDSGLLRPGRLDRNVFLGLSDGPEGQTKILSALTRKFKLAPDINFTDLLSQSQKRLTGADFYALATDALLNAIKRQIERIHSACNDHGISNPATYLRKLESGKLQSNELGFDPLEVLVSSSDFVSALDRLTPSLSNEELAHYKLLQEKFNNKQSNQSK